MKKILSLVLALTLILGVTAAPASAAGNTDTAPKFVDVPEDAWYAEAVNALAEGGLVKGDGNGHFNPNGQVTYGELQTVIGRLFSKTGKVATYPSGLAWEAYTTNYSAYGVRVVGVAQYGQDQSEFNADGTKSYPISHWAGSVNHYVGTKVLGISEMEDLNVPAIRASAISAIALAAIQSKSGTPEYVHDYKPEDIPDWDDVLGVKHHVKGAFDPETDIWDDELAPADIHVWPIDDELHFLPDEFVLQNGDTKEIGYNMRSVACHDLNGQTYVLAHPDLIMRAYNMGLVTGIDEAGTCGVYNRLTRAELCVLLYRAGLTKAASCNLPKASGYYDGMYDAYHDAKYWYN